MTIILSEQQVKNLVSHGDMDELQTFTKERVGKGMEHYVYPSKNNPNIVYKINQDRNRMEEWVELFKSHPHMFPKVFGDIRYSPKGYYYIPVEKLNTKKFESEWMKYNEICLDLFNQKMNSILYFLDDGFAFETINKLGEQVKEHYPEWGNSFTIFLNLVSSLYEIKPSADLHQKQFGYDNRGVLKCLDI